MMKISRRMALLLSSAVFLVAACSQSFAKQAQGKPPSTPAAIVLEAWNDVGNRTIAMAEDCPESKYGYRPNDKVRTFQQVLLHVAGSNYSLVNALRGQKLGNEENDPSVAAFKTKEQTVEFLNKSVADGAATIQQEGDAGALMHLRGWIGYTEHMGEHYGLLVGYYRNNGVVPPESRPKK
jgi:uncharacterized damage-inducible protein DinB